MPQAVLSAKLPSELIAELGVLADQRGISRNALVREALEASVDGRVERLSAEEQANRRFRQGLERDRHRLAAARTR